MVWGWLLRRLTSSRQGPGLWGYLAIRAQNKGLVEREKARAQAAIDVISHLPDGAVYREGTSDSWREILMPSTSQPSLVVLPAEHREPARREPPQLPELAPQPPRALRQGNKAEHDSSSGQPSAAEPPASHDSSGVITPAQRTQRTSKPRPTGRDSTNS